MGNEQPLRRTVLVAHDDADARNTISDYLRARSWEVVEAPDGLEAMIQLRRTRPGALVLDLAMPRLGGLDTVRRIRAFDPDMTVVVVMGAEDPELRRRALALGVAAVFTQPVALAALAAALGGGTAPQAETSQIQEPEVPLGGRVLIVDDEPEICALLEEFLARRGYQTRSVADGALALHAIMEELPDVVLLDFAMPRLGGLEALAAIRAVAPDAKVIMISGQANIEEAKRTLAYGAFDYITKPIELAYLSRSVDMALLWKWVAAG